MDPPLLRGVLLRRQLSVSLRLSIRPFIEAVRLVARSDYNTNAECFTEHQASGKNKTEGKGKWFTLPTYTSTVTGAALGKALVANGDLKTAGSETTALKWVLQCCPQLPRDLVQKLFRLRQVRRESRNTGCSSLSDQTTERAVKRVKAKDLMNVGDRIYLPFSVHVSPIKELQCRCSEEELNFIRSLVLYKGGIGIKRSLDELSTSCLRYDYSEPPRLVHRLDRDCSGVLVLGRTQSSTTALHSIFREKTFAASNDDVGDKKRILQRRYWALVFGRPRRPKGLVSAPLGKATHGWSCPHSLVGSIRSVYIVLRCWGPQLLEITNMVGRLTGTGNLCLRLLKMTQMISFPLSNCFLLALIWRVEAYRTNMLVCIFTASRWFYPTSLRLCTV